MRRSLVLLSMPLLLLPLSLLAIGCSTQEAPRTSWVRPGGAGSAEELSKAREECTADAIEHTKNVRPSGTATKAALGRFLDCMTKKGWQLTEEGER
jgi:hypothetical protein